MLKNTDSGLCTLLGYDKLTCHGAPVSPTHPAGSVFKILRTTKNGDAQSQPQQAYKRSPASPAQPTAAATGNGAPGVLAVASPNKTWVGVTGAIVLGTATALALEALACSLFRGGLSRAGGGISEHAEDFFSISAVRRGLACAAGVTICVVGVVGDLWESLLKRAAMVKVSVYFCRCVGGGVPSWLD